MRITFTHPLSEYGEQKIIFPAQYTMSEEAVDEFCKQNSHLRFVRESEELIVAYAKEDETG